MTRILLLALVSGALGAPAAPARPGPADGQDALAILERAGERYAALHGLCADFRQVIEVRLLGETKRSGGRMCQQPPDRFLMDFSDPEGDLVVADGESLWIYYPSTDEKQVFRSALDAVGRRFDFYQEFLADPGEKYEPTYVSRESAASGTLHVIGIVPTQPTSYDRAQLWIDDASGLIHRVRIEEENGSVRHLELTNLDVNPELDPGLFTFAPPPGASVLER